MTCVPGDIIYHKLGTKLVVLEVNPKVGIKTYNGLKCRYSDANWTLVEVLVQWQEVQETAP